MPNTNDMKPREKLVGLSRRLKNDAEQTASDASPVIGAALQVAYCCLGNDIMFVDSIKSSINIATVDKNQDDNR